MMLIRFPLQPAAAAAAAAAIAVPPSPSHHHHHQHHHHLSVASNASRMIAYVDADTMAASTPVAEKQAGTVTSVAAAAAAAKVCVVQLCFHKNISYRRCHVGSS
jgi:hypothetical protein